MALTDANGGSWQLEAEQLKGKAFAGSLGSSSGSKSPPLLLVDALQHSRIIKLHNGKRQ